ARRRRPRPAPGTEVTRPLPADPPEWEDAPTDATEALPAERAPRRRSEPETDVTRALPADPPEWEEPPTERAPSSPPPPPAGPPADPPTERLPDAPPAADAPPTRRRARPPLHGEEPQTRLWDDR
ncbi:MAG TPA: hypothetical protein VLK58_03550, partial [Conexibacter sp.]|nr:hypothetical protein [Conexibacter sp.]